MSKGRSNLQRDHQPMPKFVFVTRIAHMLVETIQQMEKPCTNTHRIPV